MKISYAIPVCNEFQEIQRLINFLLKNKRQEDEIVVLFDSNNGTKKVKDYLKSVKGINFHEGKFDGHFGNWKNRLNSFCSKDFIFQIDADEMIHKDLIADLSAILLLNPDIDLFRIARINTVNGLTPEHCKKWKWKVDEFGRINFPDYQMRLYKNDPKKIMWKNKVHECINGHEQYVDLPYMPDEFCLIHEKDIKRQEKQNDYYDDLIKKNIIKS